MAEQPAQPPQVGGSELPAGGGSAEAPPPSDIRPPGRPRTGHVISSQPPSLPPEEMETTFMDEPKTVQPVLNGLQLKIKNKPLKAFTYALATDTESINPVKRKVLVNDNEVQGDHVLVHRLEPLQKLSEVIANYRTHKYTKAVVVVNTATNLMLEPVYLEGFEGGNFPVLIISSTDGRELLDIIEHEEEDVLCDIEVESAVDAPSQHANRHHHQLAVTEQPRAGGAKGTANPQDNKSTGFRNLFKSSGGIKHEVKRLMFDGDILIPLSGDSGRFCMVMSIFQNYEHAGKPDAGQVKDALQKISRHMQPIFYNDFPFYIVLAYRLHIRMNMYQSEECLSFIMTCINLMETGPHHEIATTLKKFINKRDFTIMFGDTTRNTSVFHLLEMACIQMCKISLLSRQHALKKPPSGELHDRFISNTMIWVSLSLKVRSQRAAVTRAAAQPWKELLISRSHQLAMNEAQISGLKNGLKFGKTIDLPKELRLNAEQMCDMLVPRDTTSTIIRYFTHLRLFFHELQSSLSHEDFVIMLTNIRGSYDQSLKPRPTLNYSQFSKTGTLASTLSEGLEFINLMSEIWARRKVTSDDLKTQMHAEWQKWLQLLLKLIDVTADQADIHLKLFIKGRGVAKLFKKDIERMVIATTREHFSNLPIHRFFPLYQSFMIWPTTFLEDYLKQYKVPHDVRIKDATWTQFFTQVSERFSGAHAHYFIHDFLQSVARQYQESGRAKDFILDLLVIKVNRLLAIEPGDEEAGGEVQRNFKGFLQDFIRRNALKHSLLLEMNSIMGMISSARDEFQGLVLAVLQKEVVPEFKILQGEESLSNAAVQGILKSSVTELCRNLNWLTSLSPKQGLCWGIVATFCSKIPVKVESLNWIQDYEYLLHQLCHIYKAYCNGQGIRGEEQRRLKEDLPLDVRHYPDIRTYFEWVRRVQSVVLTWQKRVVESELNYDDIILYAGMQNGMQAIGDAIGATSDHFEPHNLQVQKNTFLQYFEVLNIMLLRYVPGKPAVKWCTLSSLLADNGVHFPAALQDILTKYVLLPGEYKEVVGGLLEKEFPHSTTGQFNAGHDISLKLSKMMGLRDLIKLVDDLQNFLQPIFDRLEMLVFFHLHQSVMFDKYQKLYLRKEAEEYMMKMHPSSTMSTFPFPVPHLPMVSLQMAEAEAKLEEENELPTLVRSLVKTTEVLTKLIKGTATYSEIIAEGSLDLENLDIEQEFDILKDYILHFKINLGSNEGLDGVRNMLELFQYTKHIMKIHGVCEQYKLQGCLDDDQLKKLVEIAQELAPEKSRRALTLNNATENMKQVKHLLFGGQQAQSHCLKLFEAVADSAAFYRFIKEKRFSGEHGQAVFSQQYQLITAQLQHEEYDEQVLNHLFAAFKFMSPFMNTRQDFKSLMTQVIPLDTSHGLKQLETVNSNITLIQLWFSRAEGDTLQNVANELECIINTGLYIFTLSSSTSGGEASMTLEYIPSAQPVLPPISTTTDEGGQPRTIHSNSGSYIESGLENGAMVVSRKENWNGEQINDFVRKLGFLDAQREGGDQTKHFLHINEVANKLLDLHIHLKDLGHPQYLKPIERRHLECKTHSVNADGEVADTEQLLRTWATRVTKLRSQHQWLLFFSVPKQLLLYQLIQQCEEENMEECVELMVREVMFLVANDPITREDLSNDIERCLPQWRDIIDNYNSMEIVGGFLGDLLQNHTLPKRSTKVIRRLSSVTQFPGMSDANQFLHHAPKYRQSQLVRLIVNIYGGVPESFEVFHCRSSSTQEELSLFLERVEKRPLRYLILEVNRLPFGLQEYLMQCYLKIQQQARRLQAEREHMQSAEHEALQSTAPGESETTAAITTTTTKQPIFPTIHFVETASSVLRELPWILPKEYKEDGPNMTFDGAQKKCKEAVKDFAKIQLVYGKAGDGKTHYIKEQLRFSTHSLTIAVNEAFTRLSALQKLRTLSPSERDCAIFLNFTMLPPGESVDVSEDQNYKELMKVIGWFFFDLILLGYVEDPVTGLSVSIPGGMGWRIYVEVPSRISSQSPEVSLAQFIEEVPALGMLGVPYAIDHNTPYTVDDDVQLVCKYLKAYWVHLEKNGQKGINKLFKEGQGKPVKFSTDPDIPDRECHELIKKSWPEFVMNPKVTQKLFIKYMRRRCAFLDQLPAFNYNNGYGEYFIDPFTGKKKLSDTRQLGSTLMDTMLQEVVDFCDPAIKENWSLKAHQQLIYDFKDGGGSFGLLSLHPDRLPDRDKTKFEKIKVKIPSMMDLYNRAVLDDYLSRALNIELEDKCLALIDKSNYVLTLDYTIKMLNIHERYECGVPVIIEGETGVGKTALVEMLSKLWNQSLLIQWKRQKDQILGFMRRRLGELTVDETMDEYMKSVRCVEEISAEKPVKDDDLITLCQLPDSSSSSRRFYTTLRSHLLQMQYQSLLPLLSLKSKTKDKRSLDELFTVCREEDNAETTATLLHAVMVSEIKSTFYKVNVHTALTPAQIRGHLQPAIDQANSLKEAYEQGISRNMSLHLPFVTVFLDEVNTSSCLGLFKEIILDRTFDGEPIPENVFIVAACNPHRGNSLAAHTKSTETWTRSTYYVRKLHPTLDFLKWDYGSLDKYQERDYINAKMKMLNKEMADVDVASLTDLIVESQELMREYARQQLVQSMTPNEAKVSSKSCVSQRDIQRVFTFFQWFQNLYKIFRQHGNREDYSRRAILVSLGIVYYMRLNTKYRAEFKQFIDHRHRLPNEVSFSQAFEEELKWFIDQVVLPTGIARTQALMENLFATILCTGTHTPLIIVGAPGSSKTLSFNLAIANLKGQESKVKNFRMTKIFHSLDPHFYQCSRRTTSNEIDTVFSRAINRQRSHSRFSLPIYCVVFMDEAGLPEESHESLKVLHYHLDRQEVSFVAITNHMLDAAKNNRAVCLFRPDASERDLNTLARGCLSSRLDSPPPELKKDLELVVKFCPAFSKLMNDDDFNHFYGLRDFIHFVNYLRRRRGQMLNVQVVMEALERNFNGYEKFDKVAESFLNSMGCPYDTVQKRSILTVLKDSLRDRPSQDGQDMSENEVRYKLIIDPSEDDSLIRLLFSLGVLDRLNTRMYVCSDFPGDSQIQKINTIAAIRHSAIEGHTVVMSQTDDIHESFYDLFNQRFRRIDDPQQGPRYYTNIAIGAHLRPCRVHPNFQCVVVVKKSEVRHTPAPFLNRFEKYCITHSTLLDTALTPLPPCLKKVILAAKEKVEDFVEHIGPDGLYGFKLDTVHSLILSLLPPVDFEFNYNKEHDFVDAAEDIKVYMLRLLVKCVRTCCGLYIPYISPEELQSDAEVLFAIVERDAEFEGIMRDIDHHKATDAVYEAVKVLHTASEPDTEAERIEFLDLSSEGCLVVLLLQQWLVRHLIKRMMQLMTSESFTEHRSKIPSSYLENYLAFQAHFSLSNLIAIYHRGLASKWEPTFPTSKILCFTRSSPLIHQLPTQYPSQAFERQSKDDVKQTLKNLVHEDVEKLMVCKLSNVPSQSHVLDLLRTFVNSETAEVLLLIVNMQEIKKQVMNHIRIMIEEEEAAHLLKEDKKQKLFLLLLHFPPSKFGSACYPSLFLRGWDHCYMDTIAHSGVTGVIDIRSWFWDCCFPQDNLPPPEEDPLIIALKEILNEAIPILASRVFFGLVHNGHFNTNMSGSKRTKILKALLFDKGVGNVLCEKFRTYWKPSVMSEYLEKAVVFTRGQDSTLNITDSIHTTFKSLFFDFLVYMISHINEDCNIDVLFLPSNSPAIQQLFLNIVRVFRNPKLSELKIRSVHPHQEKRIAYLPQFPFFKSVSGEVERLVEDSREEANTKINLMGDLDTGGTEQSITFHGVTNQQSLLLQLKEIVVRKIQPTLETEEKSILAYSLKAVEENPQIWDYYFSDFIARTLHLESPESISQRILRAFFVQLHQEKTILERVVQLHVYMNVYHLELAKMATVLRPLDRIQHVSRSAPNALSPLVTSPSKELVNVVHKTQHPLGSPEHLSAFVIGHLFNALVGAAFGQRLSPTSQELVSNPAKMLTWYKAYRDVMCLPALKQHVYSALSPNAKPEVITVEARLNVMQTVFLVLQSHSVSFQADPSEDLLTDSQSIFQTLFNRHFNEDMELKMACFPNLESVSEVAVEVVTQTGPSPKPQEEKDTNQIRLLMEGLFSHFFSPHRPGYHQEDREWFLELANQQDDWCVPNAFEEVIGGTSEQNLLDELQKSIFEKEVARTATLNIVVPKGAISICTFKMYLSRLLGECDRHNEDITKSGPLILHQPHPRLHVGQVLMKKPELGDPGPYIPTFYQECPSICPVSKSLNRRMQQPLAHLYFLTVLEHVLSDEQSLANMVRAARQLSDLCTSTVSEPAHKVMLQIELQAVLQVIARLLGRLLDTSDDRAQSVEIHGSINEINRLFADESTGGGGTGGHGMVVALHLFQKLKSSRKFIDLMTTKFEINCKEIACLRPINIQLQQKPAESTVHLLPFMLPLAGDDDLRSLYHKIEKTMIGIHKLNHDNNIKELKRIASLCNSPRRLSAGSDRSGAGKHAYNHCNFKMMMWLVIFYEFYDKKMQSPTLCNLVGTDDFSQVAKLREQEIRLFQCFLDTRLMISRPENPNPLREDEEVLELVPGGGHRRKKHRRNIKMVDPLHQLFLPEETQRIDQSDVDMRYALANMIAVVLGCEPESNHLWYHLFDQQPLWNTYLTGFMYNSKINKDGLLYDCGVELSPEGQFGRQDYLKHAGRGTYNLHSLYLILWTNFGSFCMALLVQPDSDRTIHGPLISDWLSVRHYCVSQLRTVWMHMRNNLGISDEERSFLVMRCMKRFYEVMNYESSQPETRRGVLLSTDQLNSYERLWHLCVFKPSHNEMKDKFTQYSDVMQHAVFVDIRSLQLRYPYYPTEHDLTHNVLSSGDASREDIALLCSFSHQWRRLQAGGELLPDLVELYQWLHITLAHVVSYEKACKVTIKNVIDRAVRKYSPDMGEHLNQLFIRVKAGYNRYVELIGGAIGVGACAAVRRGNKIYTIDDDIPLLYFLSDVEEEEEGNDWLYTVIADIITAHNDMVELPKQVASQPFRRLLPNQQATAYPREITNASCIIPQFKKLHGVNELIQLLRSRHRDILHTYPSFSPLYSQRATMSLSSITSTTPSSAPLFHLKELQEDIITTFIAGKPFILEVSTLRTPFRFKASIPRTVMYHNDVISTDVLTAIHENLPEEFKGDMIRVFHKRLEFDFHPADYHVMLATTTGLRTAAGHLVKFALESGGSALNQQQTLADFLLSLYDGLDSIKDVLSEIGVRKLTTTQLTCLSDLPLANLYHCLKIFASWMEEGMYDFSTLPYPLKAHLSPDDLATLRAIPHNWEDTQSDLMTEVQSMNDTLSHIESHITVQDTEQTEISITQYLRDLQLISDDERLPHHIPNTVLVQHYVELRLALRRIMSEVQHRLDQEAEEKEAAEREPTQWKEVVDDIWKEYLPHFRGAVYTGESDFLFDAATGHYGFQQYDSGSDEEDDLMGGADEGGEEEEDEFVVVPEDYEQSMLPSLARDDELSRLMQQPGMKQKLTSYAKILSKASLNTRQKAEALTPEQVAEFIESIGLGQYVGKFLEDEVNGEMLLEASDNDLAEFGVESRLHRVKIITLFQRLALGRTVTCLSVDEVIDFLKSQKLDKFIETFRANGIDGDILDAILARKEEKVWVDSKGGEMSVTDLILHDELGMTTAVQRLRVKGKIKSYTDSLASVCSKTLASSKVY